MSRPHRACKVDANQQQIVQEARDFGFYVWVLSDLGGEVLDALFCLGGKCIPVEIKMPGHEDDFTDGEDRAVYELQRRGCAVIIATCFEDVLRQWPEEA